MGIGDWRLEIRDWRLEIRDWRLEIGDWRLENYCGSAISNLYSLISLLQSPISIR
ncbi:MAG: hypothetical protein M1434_12650 [Chloroflexi bacterium]|nr:hypothetical protein [Chloroflexota bacterium]MCL5275573.1 hypothetical protein [Chloroflexota bacterium]